MAKKTMKKRYSARRRNKGMTRITRRTRRKVSRKKYHRKRTKRLKMRGGAAAGVTPDSGNQVITGITRVYVREDGFVDDQKCGENCSFLKWFCNAEDLSREILTYHRSRMVVRLGDQVTYGGALRAVEAVESIDDPGWLWVGGPSGRCNVFLKKYIEARLWSSWGKWDYYVELKIKDDSPSDKGHRWKFRYKTKQLAAEEAVKMIT